MEELSRLARKLGPGAKLPTAREMAATLGVTTTTILRSLDRLERQGVLRRRQGSGIYVEEAARQKTIALVMGQDIFSAASYHFGALLLQYCTKRAAIGNERFSFFIDTFLKSSAGDQRQTPAHQDLVDALQDGKIDGMLLLARSSVEQEVWLRSHGIPLVGMEGRVAALDRENPTVMVDYETLIDMGVSRLKEKGCCTAGLMGILAEHRGMFEKALKRHGLTGAEKWQVLPKHEDSSLAPLHVKIGRDFGTAFLRQCEGRGPDGLIITDDIVARAALPVLREGGLKAGQDLIVCTHANKGSIVLSEWMTDIHLLEVDPEELVSAMFGLLEGLMAGESMDRLARVRPHLVPTSLS